MRETKTNCGLPMNLNIIILHYIISNAFYCTYQSYDNNDKMWATV